MITGRQLLFRYPDPHAIRLDHYLASHCHRLPSDRRLRMLRDIADAIRYAHRQRVIHRALSPQSILVLRDEGGRARLEAELATKGELLAEDVTDFRDPSKLYTQVFNWQLGVRQSSNVSGLMTHVEDQVECQSLVYMAPEALLGRTPCLRSLGRLFPRSHRVSLVRKSSAGRQRCRTDPYSPRQQRAQPVFRRGRCRPQTGRTDSLVHAPRCAHPCRFRGRFPQPARWCRRRIL
ncbi:MAG UNVERIFIED_CONTAM: hypothetical protein LVR18_50925 [Planctomycetaceae bacterium]